MKTSLYHALYRAFTVVIFCGILFMCYSNIKIAQNPDGLRITEVTQDSIILNAGSSKFQVTLDSTDGYEVGDYVETVDALKPHIKKVVTFNIVVMIIITVVFIIDAADLRGLIQASRAKKGIKLDAVIAGYSHLFLGLWTVCVDAHGTIYRARFPIFKCEQHKYPVGKHVIVWNGGVKRVWVDLDHQQE